MIKFRVIFRSLVCLCIPSILPVAESDDTVDCSTDSTDFSDDAFTVTCPGGCSTNSASVWGTGVYTSDSSICRAAIHDGRITNAGGQVTVYRWPGQDSYQASERNGIETESYGSWEDAFVFTRDVVDCSTDSRGFEDDTFTVTCPAGCSQVWDERVWGTDIYGDASSICRAAIHDGKITNDGGQVTVYKWPGQDSYQDSYKNGISTLSYGSWDGSVAFMPVCPLGMEDRTIEDDDITASSYQQSRPPSDARLNGDSAWRPLSNSNSGPWIQVDLRQRRTVSGVITQGYDGPGSNNYWITRYEVHYLSASGNWEAIKTQTGDVVTFSGNTGRTGQKTNMFDSPIVTQKIRLYPTDWWWRGPGLRMELLGCDFIASTTQPTTVIRTTSTASVTLSTAVETNKTAVLDGGHDERKDPRGSLGVGAIAGIAAGVSVVLIALVVFVIIFLRKRQSNNKGESNIPKNPPEQRFRNPEYSDVTATNEHTAPAQDEGYTDCELYNTEDSNPYEPYIYYANSGQISGGEISQPSHDYDYATIPGESDRGVVDNVIYETSDMT